MSAVCLHFLPINAAAPIIVGCEANSECAQEEACLNGDCVDPCNCGRNAYCRVFQHTPLCYCPEGYSGNPEVGCEKREYGLEVGQ